MNIHVCTHYPVTVTITPTVPMVLLKLWWFMYYYRAERQGKQLWCVVTSRLYVCMYVCTYVCISVPSSYGHLTRGLEIVSVAIPMASICSTCPYNKLNSRFRLLPTLHCNCGSQLGDRLRQVSDAIFYPHPRQNPSKSLLSTGMASVSCERVEKKWQESEFEL